MSFVSILPFGQTFFHWWRELEGEGDRLWFMLAKVVEVSAFAGNALANARRSFAEPKTPPPPRAVNTSENWDAWVVVPAYCTRDEDATRLRNLLVALERQTVPCQVVIIDDGSPRPLEQHFNVVVIRLRQNRGPATARNHGIEYALERGAGVVLLTDADCVPEPDWVAVMVSSLRVSSVHGMAGATWSLDSSSLGRYHERNGTLNGRRFRGQDYLLYAPTCNVALRAQLAEELRFDESFPYAAAEDIDYWYRAHREGWRLGYEPRAIVRHDNGYDGLGPFRKVARFWRQFRRYAVGERQLLDKHPEYHVYFAESDTISCGR